jgi:very-short-patch-repair endonuclease
VWERLLPRVYRTAGGRETPQQRALASVLWAGPGSLVSHATAASLWAMTRVRARGVELWVPSGNRRTESTITVHRGTRLDRADRTSLDSIPITTPTRTLIDVAGRLEDDALLDAMEDLFRRGLSSPERFAARLEALRSSGRPGGGRLEGLLARRPSGAAALESRLEAMVWRLLDGSSLPRPTRQHWVVADGLRCRLDYAWPDERVAVECDGWAYHGGREHFDRDELRRASLASAGWLVVPVTWTQCASAPDAVIQRIAHALGRSRAGSLRNEYR